MDQSGNASAVIFRAGAHLPNNGRLSAEDLDLVSRLALVKALVRLDNMGRWDEVDWRALGERLRPDCLVILRLFFPGRLDPAEFIKRAAARLPAILQALDARPGGRGGGREVLIEIHNEPNHAAGIEGWDKSRAAAVDFAGWFARVFCGLRDLGFGGLGWPGLALSEHAHGERSWMKVNRRNIRASDWIGVHCYWQRAEEIDDRRLGGNWRLYRRRWPNKRILVTEAANSSCHNAELPQVGPDRQRAEYLAWCRAAAAGGVAGVAFYMLGGSEDWRGFRLYPETVRALADIQ